MPPELEPNAPVAPDDEIVQPSDAALEAPSDSVAATAPEDTAKLLRDRLAEQGRANALERQRREAAEQQLTGLQARVDQLTQVVGSVYQRQAAEEQAAQEARLNALPPAERAEARVQMLQQQVKQMQQQAAPRQGPTPQEYAAQRSRELVEMANRRFGLSGDAALTVDELPQTAWATEPAFIAALDILGSQRASSPGEDRVTTKAKPKDADREALKQEIRQDVLQEMGISRPNAARPAARGGAAPGMAEMNKVLVGARSNVRGTAGARNQLRAMRDEIAGKQR